ncbi:MAG: efflux RND transporter periplasmic adaptor subunit [bacterium]
MKRLSLIVAIVITILFAFSATAQTVANAGKYRISVATRPTLPAQGENQFIISVMDGSKPLTGAAVTIHIDMATMPMPADFTATPGANPGEYIARVFFSMAGEWKVDITVAQMAGMKMDGDGTARLMVATGKSITAKNSGNIPWTLIGIILLVVAVLATAILYRVIPPKPRGYIVGVLTLIVVLAGTIFIVRKYRDPKQSTLLASANMDMSGYAAPGTQAVNTETAHYAAFTATAGYTGTVVADQEEEIFPRVIGQLIYMPLYPGDKVTPGQVVARLDSRELSTKEAQAAYGNSAANQGITASAAELNAAKASLTKAENTRMAVEAQLSQAETEKKTADSNIIQAHEQSVQAYLEKNQAQTDVQYWRLQLKRKTLLFDQGAISQKDLDDINNTYTNAIMLANKANSTERNAQAGEARAQNDLIIAKSKIDEAQAALAGAVAEKSAAQASIDAATARMNAASSTAGQAGAQLDEAATIKGYTEIKAAVGGIVTARNVAPGTLVEPGTSIMKISKVDVVRLQVNISEADLARVKIGQTLTAHVINAPDDPITTQISAIFPASDASSRTAIVESRIPNPNMRLRPGQYLAVDLSLGSSDAKALTVPTNALIARDGMNSVYVAMDSNGVKVAKRVTVTTGRLGNGRVEILNGINDGDQVITSGIANLRDGDVITVLHSGENAASSATMATPVNPVTDKNGVKYQPGDAVPTPVMENHVAPDKISTSTTSMPKVRTPEAVKPVAPISLTWYHCPMHHEVESNSPGTCPLCGMDLVKFDKV